MAEERLIAVAAQDNQGLEGAVAVHFFERCPNLLTPEQKEFRRNWVVLFSALESFAQFGLKLGAALYTGSAALLVDSIHSLADVAGSLAVWLGVWVCLPRVQRDSLMAPARPLRGAPHRILQARYLSSTLCFSKRKYPWES